VDFLSVPQALKSTLVTAVHVADKYARSITFKIKKNFALKQKVANFKKNNLTY
jgi:hypothetical protein